jgi:hypothetical protein
MVLEERVAADQSPAFAITPDRLRFAISLNGKAVNAAALKLGD